MTHVYTELVHGIVKIAIEFQRCKGFIGGGMAQVVKRTAQIPGDEFQGLVEPRVHQSKPVASVLIPLCAKQ